ncbi:MAG: lactonase family protein, partial [Clostridia bacterium]
AGSYAKPQEEGIARFLLDTEAKTLRKQCGYQGVKNPSYVLLNAAKNRLYAVEEEAGESGGRVHVLQLTNGAAEWVQSLSTQGADPCHLCLAQGGTLLLASNYSSGSLAVMRVEEKGGLCFEQLIQHTGKGSHPTRQEMAHVHSAWEWEQLIAAVDLGLDKVSFYELRNGALCETGRELRLAAGSGPRHLAFDPLKPSVLYVACELSSEVAVFEWRGTEFALLQTVSTLPTGVCGENTAAAIRLCGSLLYVSNRGHDSISVFERLCDGTLRLLDCAPCGGNAPRDFAVFGEYLVIANQASDNLSVLKMNKARGKLEQTGISAVMARPSCICGSRHTCQRRHKGKG